MPTRPSSSCTRQPSDKSDIAPLSPRLARLLDELLQARYEGKQTTAADLIHAHPDLNSEEAVQLVYEEYCQKRDDGEEVDSTELLLKFPQFQNQLKTVLQFEKLLEKPRPEHVFPEPGTTVGPFHLIRRLGRGAAGRTYLAQEKSLGDRHVVVKIMPGEQEEHLTLARLQHTHIMPLFSELMLPETGLRLLCMPYLGGAGLHEILAGLKEKGIPKCNGRDLIAMLDSLSGTEFQRIDMTGPSRQLILKSSYADTIAFIGASIAEAAHEAHARGLVHMDIKPSNILISADAEPLLLDFHLARKPVLQGERRVDRLGGTRGWMSPEQSKCFEAATQGQPMPCSIDGRSDQYSIGLLMADALHCISRDGQPQLNFTRDLPTGLADIIRRCLADHPGERYPSAALLADDLRRHLASLPLKGVKNRSLAERWQKWKKRNPAGPVWLVATALIFPLVSYTSLLALQSRGRAFEEAAVNIADSRKWMERGDYDTAIQRLDATRRKISAIPANSFYLRQLDRNLAQARRLKLAAQLNFVMDRVRFQYGAAELAGPARAKLKQQCQVLWDRRHELIQGESLLDADFNKRMARQIKADLIELAVIMADLISRDSAVELQTTAQTIIKNAETDLGPDFSLTLARIRLSGTSNKKPLSASAEDSQQPGNAWEFHQLGQSLARQKRLPEAHQAYARAASLEPDQFWFQYDLAVCLHGLKQFEEGLAAWSAAIALRPQSAVCRYNRGITWQSLNNNQNALADFQQATTLDPSMADAWLQAGLLFNAAGQYAKALAALEQAVQHADDRALKARTLFRQALIYQNLQKPNEARSAATRAAELGSLEATHWLRTQKK